MNTSEFLRAILPADCWYFVATPSPTGKGFKHFACQTIEEAAARALYLDAEQKQNVYFACSGYRADHVMKMDNGVEKKKFRTKENVKLVKAFWLDLDVGATEPGMPAKYPTQAAAVQALGQFLVAAKLPKPMIVNSGYGVHCYWPLTAAILPGQWASTAMTLKALTGKLGLLADNSRTSDEASILRPVGTHNRKVKNGVQGAMPVSCSSAVELFDYAAFHAAVSDAAAKSGTELPHERQVAAGGGDTVNPTGLIVPVGGFQKSSADRVASLCQQVHVFKETGGVSEPQWYAALQVVAFAENGDKHVHDWSAKYPSYSFDETETKLNQVKSFGPTTCAKLDDVHPEGCRGCKYKGKITSPIQLGIEVKEAKAPVVAIQHGDTEVLLEVPSPPVPFIRGAEDQPGLYIDVEGIPIRFYPYDLYPIELCKDVEMGYEITRVKHFLPHEGWGEFVFRSALVASQRDFLSTLMDNSIKPENAKMMAAYMTSYLQELQSKTKIRKLYGSMGWKDEGFLLGRKLHTPSGAQPAGVSNKVSHEMLDSIAVGGTLEGWQAGIKKLDQPGLEAHLFSFLVGFGAPLFAVTGYDGAMLSMLGDTNSGKTLSSKAMLSIYGKYKGLRIGKKDTLNAKIEKMSMLGNLPVYIDELTNTEADELSQFIYQVSEGRGRARLRSDSTMREAAEWQTLGITSTNASLVAKLASGKDNAEAEMVRILEYRVEKLPWFERQMTEVHEAVTSNYGHAGERYVDWLVKSDRGELKQNIAKVVESLMATVSFQGKERYWINTIAVILYGAVAAQALGLLQFSDFPATYRRLFAWSCGLIQNSRGEVAEAKIDDLTILAQFMDSNTSGRLVVNEQVMGHMNITQIIKPPVGQLVARYEQHTGFVFIDRKALKKYMVDRQVDYTPMRRKLAELGVLVNADKKKVLGAGTSFTGGQVDTWQINGRHPLLADILGEPV